MYTAELLAIKLALQCVNIFTDSQNKRFVNLNRSYTSYPLISYAAIAVLKMPLFGARW